MAKVDADFDESEFIKLPVPYTGLPAPNPEIPSQIGFPALFPFELALGQYGPRELCEEYGLTKAEFAVLLDNPVFVNAYNRAREMIAKDGTGFKVKAKLQAEVIIDTAYKMAHNEAIPAPVRADMIKSIVRWAEYEPKKDAGSGSTQAFQININF